MASSQKLYETIGSLIKDRRNILKITQEELARQVKLTRTSITNIEQGKQRFGVHTLFEIASALKLHPSALLPTSEFQSSDFNDLTKSLESDEREFARSILKKHE